MIIADESKMSDKTQTENSPSSLYIWAIGALSIFWLGQPRKVHLVYFEDQEIYISTLSTL